MRHLQDDSLGRQRESDHVQQRLYVPYLHRFGFQFPGFGFQVSGVGCRASGFGLRFSGSGFMVEGTVMRAS